MKRPSAPVAVALFVAANATLAYSGPTDSDFAFLAIFMGIGLAFGLSIGRWWALVAPAAWIPIVLIALGGDTELSVTGLVIFVAGPAWAVQAICVAGGVLPIWLKGRSNLAGT